MRDAATETPPRKAPGVAAPEAELPIRPADEHNRELVANVHPQDWRNPEPADRYHLVVVGAGTAGLVTAAGAAGLGARVALVERHLMGGDCLNVGCVPSKGIIRAARSWHEARHAARRFGGPEVAGDGDFAAAMERMRRLRAGISHHDSAERFQGLGVDVFLSERGGQFVASDALEVDGTRLRFRKAVVATGGRAAVPPIEGLAEAGYLTNDTLFELEELPRSLAVLGGGPIGCEMAQTFARFGSQVTVLDMAEHVLPREDADAAEIVQDSMARDGVAFELGVQVRSVERRGGEAVIRFERPDGGSGEVACDHLLLSVGRSPNVEGLGLEAAGVEYSKQGVQVDDRLRTTNPRIYAAGDVASKYQFTHVADALARIAIQNALFFGRARASDLVVPWCTYTSPEVAHVGLSAHEAEGQGRPVETLTVPLAELDRAILDGEDEGFLRVHLEKGKDRLVGATLVASHAGDMLGELCLAISEGVGLGRIAGVIHPYPTQGEAVKKAADTWRRGKLTPFVKRVFDWRFRVMTRLGF
ncbi:MAG: mercuric reductase [Thermoanaerobaculia bacterium]